MDRVSFWIERSSGAVAAATSRRCINNSAPEIAEGPQEGKTSLSIQTLSRSDINLAADSDASGRRPGRSKGSKKANINLTLKT